MVRHVSYPSLGLRSMAFLRGSIQYLAPLYNAGCLLQISIVEGKSCRYWWLVLLRLIVWKHLRSVGTM